MKWCLGLAYSTPFLYNVITPYTELYQFININFQLVLIDCVHLGLFEIKLSRSMITQAPVSHNVPDATT